jgi:uncharacterized protein YbjT (DUF2867 family)
VVVGDLKDAAFLRTALRGVDQVVFAATATAGGGADNTPQTVDYGGVVNVVEAAREARPRILLISSSAVTQPLHPHNMWNDILSWKFRGEQYLRGSGLRYTIVRPCGMRDFPGGHDGIGIAQGDQFAFGYIISRDDAAEVCVQALATARTLGCTFEAYNDTAIAPGPLAGRFATLTPDAPSPPAHG